MENESKRKDRLAKVIARNFCNSTYGNCIKSIEELQEAHANRVTKQPELEKKIRAQLEVSNYGS